MSSNRQQMDSAFKSLEKVVRYLENDECRNYKEAGRPRDHIYRDVFVLRQWVDSVNRARRQRVRLRRMLPLTGGRYE
jgi:hypothetical protein